ncbi:hypothetical protein M514_05416, partial [Trichuris suis]
NARRIHFSYAFNQCRPFSSLKSTAKALLRRQPSAVTMKTARGRSKRHTISKSSHLFNLTELKCIQPTLMERSFMEAADS